VIPAGLDPGGRVLEDHDAPQISRVGESQLPCREHEALRIGFAVLDVLDGDDHGNQLRQSTVLEHRLDHPPQRPRRDRHRDTALGQPPYQFPVRIGDTWLLPARRGVGLRDAVQQLLLTHPGTRSLREQGSGDVELTATHESRVLGRRHRRQPRYHEGPRVAALEQVLVQAQRPVEVEEDGRRLCEQFACCRHGVS
jgi:hypothetical protein